MTRKRIRLTAAALRENPPVSADTMRKRARERGWEITRDGDGPTSPDLVYEADVRAYERRTSVLDSDLSYGAERRGSQYAGRR